MDSLSYSYSPEPVIYTYTTLPALLDSRAVQYPDAECHVFLEYTGKDQPLSRTAVTFKDLAEKSINVASELLKLGLRPGDRIAAYGRSIPEWLYIEYACFRLQILMMPIPVSLIYSDQLLTFIRGHRIKALVLDLGQDENIVQKIVRNIPSFVDVVRENGPVVADQYPSMALFLHVHSNLVSVASWSEQEAPQDAHNEVLEIQSAIDPDDVAVIYATSGSTGIPKIVTHSHFTLINVMKSIGTKTFGTETFFNDRPFSWLAACHHYPVIVGATRVHINAVNIEQWDYAKLVLDTIRTENVRTCGLVTYSLQDLRTMITTGEEELPSCLRKITTGGEKIPQDLVEFFNKLLPVIVGYGATEFLSFGLFDSRRDGFTLNGDTPALLYTPEPGEIRLVDAGGRCVARGTPGIIQARNVLIFRGYLDDPEHTAATITPSGWTGPGDMAIMHDSGQIEILGRPTDLIIKGTIKLYPAKQEAMLMQHEKVGKAVVCGIPDPKYYEEICACVVPEPGYDVTVEELRHHCSKFQPTTMRVSLVPEHYMICDKLPQTTNGKVDKKRIKEQFIEMARLSK